MGVWGSASRGSVCVSWGLCLVHSMLVCSSTKFEDCTMAAACHRLLGLTTSVTRWHWFQTAPLVVRHTTFERLGVSHLMRQTDRQTVQCQVPPGRITRVGQSYRQISYAALGWYRTSVDKGNFRPWRRGRVWWGDVFTSVAVRFLERIHCSLQETQ